MARGVPDKYGAIVQAAVSEFARAGFDGARMADIAHAAGVASGTPYLYFKGKSDLLVAVFRCRVGQITESVAVDVAREESPVQRLRRFVQGHLRALAADPEMAVVTQIEVRQSNPEIRGQINAVMNELYFPLLEAIIESGQASGDFRRDVDAKLIRNMVFGTLDQTATAWVLTEQRWDLASQADQIFGLLLSGLTATAPDPGVT